MNEDPPADRLRSSAGMLPISDRCIATPESPPTSALTAACSAAIRAAAVSVRRAPDSSSRTGHTPLFHSACSRSQAGEPTSP